MRSATDGIVIRGIRLFDKNIVLEVFRRMCKIRYFELQAKSAYEAGLIRPPMYLSVGQESVAAALSVSFESPAIFGQHRVHDFYLAYGGNPEALRDELLHKSTGCSHGMGGSASLHGPDIKLFGHDGLIGSQIPIATGYAIGKRGTERVLAIMGDASAEEDYTLGAEGFGATRKLPILYVCVDNGLSILTKVAVRRNWNATDVASAFGLASAEITDDPWTIMWYVQQVSSNLPAFLNIHTVRYLWHAGTGSDGPPEWERFLIVKEDLRSIGLEKEATRIEEEMRAWAENLWSAGRTVKGVV